jgi:hypothetical protein
MYIVGRPGRMGGAAAPELTGETAASGPPEAA